MNEFFGSLLFRLRSSWLDVFGVRERLASSDAEALAEDWQAVGEAFACVLGRTRTVTQDEQRGA